MPCICYGAVSGDEEYDKFIKSEMGQEVMRNLKNAAALIKSADIHEECMPMEFRQMFVKALLHMLIGCDEQGRPKLNGMD